MLEIILIIGFTVFLSVYIYFSIHNITTLKRFLAYFITPMIIYKVKRDKYCKTIGNYRIWVREFSKEVKVVFYYESIYEYIMIYKNDAKIASWEVSRIEGITIYNFYCYSKEFNKKSLKPIYNSD